MLIDMRLYNTVTGMTQRFIDLYVADGLPIQRRHCGDPVGFYAHEFGPQEQVVLLWRYASFADREAKRAALDQEAGWLNFLTEAAPLMRHHETRLLRPVAGALPFTMPTE